MLCLPSPQVIIKLTDQEPEHLSADIISKTKAVLQARG
jgi:hypothetical protein